MGLRFGKTVLIEVLALVQKGLLEGIDVSQALRDIEVEVDSEETDKLRLTDEYVDRQKAAREWED